MSGYESPPTAPTQNNSLKNPPNSTCQPPPTPKLHKNPAPIAYFSFKLGIVYPRQPADNLTPEAPTLSGTPTPRDTVKPQVDWLLYP